MPPAIKRGEIYWLDWSPGRGSEQIGKRPALVIQNNIGNRSSPTTIVACCTRTVKAYPFVVPITRRESGLPDDCAVNLSQIITVDKNRLSDKAGQLAVKRLNDIDAAIRVSLGLGEVD